MNYSYFSTTELSCRCGQCELGPESMDPAFMTKVVLLRAICGFPFPVSSSIRCPAYNAQVSSTGETGPHVTGRAIDIIVSREQAFKLLREAMKMNFTGIGVQQKGNKRFIHLDDLERPEYPRPNIWSY